MDSQDCKTANLRREESRINYYPYWFARRDFVLKFILKTALFVNATAEIYSRIMICYDDGIYIQVFDFYHNRHNHAKIEHLPTE